MTTFDRWRTAANKEMLAQYCISLKDSGLDNEELLQHFLDFSDPVEFVEWFGRKYDLTPIYAVAMQLNPARG